MKPRTPDFLSCVFASRSYICPGLGWKSGRDEQCAPRHRAGVADCVRIMHKADSVSRVRSLAGSCRALPGLREATWVTCACSGLGCQTLTASLPAAVQVTRRRWFPATGLWDVNLGSPERCLCIRPPSTCRSCVKDCKWENTPEEGQVEAPMNFLSLHVNKAVNSRPYYSLAETREFCIDHRLKGSECWMKTLAECGAGLAPGGGGPRRPRRCEASSPHTVEQRVASGGSGA